MSVCCLVRMTTSTTTVAGFFPLGYVDYAVRSARDRYCPGTPFEIKENVTMDDVPGILNLAYRGASEELWEENTGGFIASLLWPVFFVILLFVGYVVFVCVNRYTSKTVLQSPIRRDIAFYVGGVMGILAIVMGILNMVAITDSDMKDTHCTIFNALSQAVNGREDYFSGLYPAKMGLNLTNTMLADTNPLKKPFNQNLELLRNVPTATDYFKNVATASPLGLAYQWSLPAGPLGAVVAGKSKSYMKMVSENFLTNDMGHNLNGVVNSAFQVPLGVYPDPATLPAQYATSTAANLLLPLIATANSPQLGLPDSLGADKFAALEPAIQLTKPWADNVDFHTKVNDGMVRMDEIHYRTDELIRKVEYINLGLINGLRLFFGCLVTVLSMVSIVMTTIFIFLGRSETTLNRVSKVGTRVCSRWVIGSVIALLIVDVILSFFGHALGSVCADMTDDSDEFSMYDRIATIGSLEPDNHEGILYTCFDEKSDGLVWKHLGIDEQIHPIADVPKLILTLGTVLTKYVTDKVAAMNTSNPTIANSIPWVRAAASVPLDYAKSDLFPEVAFWTTSSIKSTHLPATAPKMLAFEESWARLLLATKPNDATECKVTLNTLFPEIVTAHGADATFGTRCLHLFDVAVEYKTLKDDLAAVNLSAYVPSIPGVPNIEVLDGAIVAHIGASMKHYETVFNMGSYFPTFSAAIPAVIGAPYKLSLSPSCHYLNVMLRASFKQVCTEVAAPALSTTVYSTLMAIFAAVFWFVSNKFYKEQLPMPEQSGVVPKTSTAPSTDAPVAAAAPAAAATAAA